MHTLKVTISEGLNTLTIEEIQTLEGKLDIGLSVAGFERIGTTKMDEETTFYYRKQLNGVEPS